MDRRTYRRRSHLSARRAEPPLRRPGAPQLLVALHGYQDEPDEMLAIADALDPARAFSFVAPRGPVETARGPAWFIDEPDATANHSLIDSIDSLDELIATEAHAAGLDPADTIVVGYSQGAGVALALALRRGAPRRVRAVVALAGFLPHADGLDWAFAEAVGTTDVLFVHGTRDETVPAQQGRSAARVLERHEVGVTWVEVDAGHELSPLLDPATTWLAARA